MANGMSVLAKEAILISTEYIEKGGEIFEVSTYDENGVIVETVSIKEKKSTIINSSIVDESKRQMLLDISEERNGFKQNQGELSINRLSNPYEFNKGAVSSTNSNVYAGHWGVLEGKLINPFRISSYNGASRGYYSGSGNADKIQLAEIYTFNGASFSISWPPGVTPSSNSATWRSLAYSNTSLATGYRPNFSARSIQPFFGLKIDSRADIYLGSKSYPATVSTSASIWDWSL